MKEKKLSNIIKRYFIRFKKKTNILIKSYELTYRSLTLKNVKIFWISIILGIIFLFLTLNNISEKFIIQIPSFGGTINEGMINNPRYINPVVAISESDKDMVNLIYSGLTKKDINGNIVNDLAENIEESEDHLTFKIKINEKAKFHDDVKVTADDVIFTFSKIKNKNINSPLAINFEGIDIEKDGDFVVFHLKKPFYYFKESLSFGILPKHIWENVSDEEFSLASYNLKPIGSGPYKISNTNENDNIIDTYHLTSFKDYIYGRPYIDNINIYIYKDNEELLKAFKNRNIDLTSYSDTKYIDDYKKEKANILNINLSNIFSMSLNPSKNNLLGDKKLRNDLDLSINKNSIISDIFKGNAKAVDYIYDKNQSTLNSSTNTLSITEKITEINLSTVDIEELRLVAENIAKDWEKIGIKTNIKLYSISEIGDIIKNRDFEALLFGFMVSKDTDLYAYLHSDQRNYPGLNITGYASKKLDKNLEILKDSIDKEERDNALKDINIEIKDEDQIIPIYSNNLIYIIRNKNFEKILEEKIPKNLNDKSEKYQNISEWYMYTEKVWKFTYLEKLIEKLENLIH